MKKLIMDTDGNYIQNQFCSYEIALKLKELGFDEISRFGQETSLYTKEGKHTFYANYGFMGSGLSGGYIYAPLWQQVIDWFRVKYNICVVIQCVNWRLGKQFEGYLCKFQTKEMIDKGDYSKYIYLSDLFITYEEAREYIILKAIELCQKY